MANTYLSRASYGTPTSTKIFTWSCWFKIGQSQGKGRIFDFYAPPFVYGNGIFFTVGGELGISGGDSNNARRITSRVFRDPSAWYHVVGVFDSPNSVAEDRLRLYVNGVRETSFSASVDMTQNQDYQAFRSDVGGIGTYYDKTTSSEFFDGSMSHIHFIDGTVYDATAFGEFDANGVWKIKTSPSVTYGNNGFFILKDGNSVTDQSGNGNNFTVAGGTLTNTEDCPSNVFATLNPLKFYNGTLSIGNLQLDSSTNSWKSRYSTLGVSDGKYYMEFKMGSVTDDQSAVSIVSDNTPDGNAPGVDANTSPAIAYLSNGTKLVNGTATTSYFSAMSTNDIIGIALNMDGGTVQFYKNGSASGSIINLSDAFTSSNYPLFFGGSVFNTRNIQANFGNGYFGTTPVASAGTNASGNGIFEYDVPTGYTALSTKGLNL